MAINKDITPTLYKLYSEGMKFNNFYSPIYNCSTSDGEFVSLLSLIPGVSVCSMDKTINKNNAQLIYTAHSTFLFNSENLRRDELYLVDKDEFGKSNLYSLSELLIILAPIKE